MNKFLFLLLIVFSFCGIVAAQAPADQGKKNSRPADLSTKDPHVAGPQKKARTPSFFYEFIRPGFTYSPLRIEHDDDGLGKITFVKDGFEESITDPISLSPVTMARIREILDALDFVNSSEDYQYSRDYSHLGNVTITVDKGGKKRTAKYNWTENKHAKELSDEYRRIGNEYTWLFELGVARQNQPLRTPGMMDALDSLLRRNEIPDPPHLIPYLTTLSTDERLPLMARNHAIKLIQKIEKSTK